jgi:hypothetical protein
MSIKTVSRKPLTGHSPRVNDLLSCLDAFGARSRAGEAEKERREVAAKVMNGAGKAEKAF